jgi:ketosteroid isomerase-like protein
MARPPVDTVREGFDALNDGDLERMVALTAPDVVFLPLAAPRVEGRHYEGHDGLREWHSERAATWSLAYTLDEIVAVGERRVLVHGALHSRGASSGGELDTRASWVIEVGDDGLIGRIEAFLDRDAAERAARA